MEENIPLALEARKITKRFPGVVANYRVDFSLKKGEIHGLLGENGAGKSTLMNVIYGLYSADEGEIFIDGEMVEINNPHDAINLRIGMVHQHFMLVPVFSVTENIILGAEVMKGTTLDLNKARQDITRLSEGYGLKVDPISIIEEISVGVQQRVEILKALFRDANILIFDEPTAVLTPQEADDLFRIMRQLTEQGVSIVFITHKLREVMDIADRITVMRRGEVVGTTTPQEIDKKGLAEMMVGREVILEVEKDPASPAEPVLKVMNLSVNDERGMGIVHDISFEVRRGEILGIAGVQGNGQTEVAEALSGLRKPASGKFYLNGIEMPYGNPRKLIEAGLSHIPEDRQRHGLVMSYSVADNMVLCTYYKSPFAKGLQRDRKAVMENAVKLIADFDVRTPGPMVHAGKLSGGNQQKVIVARELSRPVQLLLANQPTRGLDVGSIEYIHKRIIEERDNGAAVLFISAELDEIMSLADRIAVMYQGEIVSILQADQVTKAELGLLMAGSEV